METAKILKRYTDAAAVLRDKKSSNREKERAQKIVDEINLEDFKMLMRMDGNDHIYYHDLHMYPITRQQINIIPTDDTYPFILKLNVDSRYECGGTQYIRYHIVKVTKPTLHDFMTPEFIKTASMEEIANITDTYNCQQEVVNRKYKEYMALVDLNFENKNAKKAYEEAISAQIAAVTKYYFTHIPPPLPIKFSELHQVEPIKPPSQPETNAIVYDGRILFTRRKLGRIFNYYSKAFKDVPYQIADSEIQVVDQELINNMVSKIILASKFDNALLRSLVGMCNKEQPLWDINQHILPIIMVAIQQAVRSEATLHMIINSLNVSNLNAFKNGEMKITPQSWTQAWKMGQFWNYLWMLLTTPINQVSSIDTNPALRQDF
jgi:hypothetical protein